MNAVAEQFLWTEDEYQTFGDKVQVCQHKLHERREFGDEYLTALLDRYPRRNVQIYHMGEDPENNSEWEPVDLADDTTGEQMIHALKNGRIWINLTHIEKHSSEFADMLAGIYSHMGEKCPRLENPRPIHSQLLLSSPGAQVYYHLDAEPNMLWHIRGQKKVWVYPAMDFDFVSQEHLEDIFAGEIIENIPFRAEFDDRAEHFLLNPGDVVTWPHNSPHRMVNVDFNISLASSYYSPVVYQREYVQLANRFILRNLGVESRSVNEHGLTASAKRTTYRVVNKLRPFKRRNRAANFKARYQLDPAGPLGLRELDVIKPASFASHAGEYRTISQDT